jgi:hypothetical protein
MQYKNPTRVRKRLLVLLDQAAYNIIALETKPRGSCFRLFYDYGIHSMLSQEEFSMEVML